MDHTRNSSTSIFLCVAFALFLFADASYAADATSNLSFETVENDAPESWVFHHWNGEGQGAIADVAHSGRHSVVLSSEKGGDLSWMGDFPVRPFSKYRLSGWIKTEDIQAGTGLGALFNMHGMARLHTPAVTGTRDWTQIELTFETLDRTKVQVNCLLGGWGLSTGKAWFDDVKLEWISTMELNPSLSLDGKKTGEPVSPYIYGQFIEHLGRCIYGGIWAEMLEDRKFFDAVDQEDGAWQTLGSAQVKMVETGSYVGRWSPLVTLPGGGVAGGIVQKNLAVRKGDEYVGRIVLAGSEHAAPVDVSLVWGEGPDTRETIRIESLSSDFKKSPLRFKAEADSDDARLEIVSRGQGAFMIGTVSLMPADNVDGMRPDTLKLLKELNSPIYRWPGGNFVSGYDWRDGIGDPDKRPPRKNPAWLGIEHNDFGLHEFMHFCEEVGTEPLIVVNSGLGSTELAVDEIEYVNGTTDSKMGRWRAENGHKAPYNVKWWGIGNEMYGDWQLGHIPLEEYVKKNNEFADAMRAVDPKVKLIAVGAVGDWSKAMLEHSCGHMDYLSEHFYCGEEESLISHIYSIPNNIQRIADAHREYRQSIPALKGKDIRIALDEWNYWYGPHLYGELGVRYYLKDALGVAAGLNAFIRNSEMYIMANYAQTVNVIGCIKTTQTDACFATTGLALKLYREEFGSNPLPFDSDTKPLDVAAALSDDGKTLTVGIVNPTQNDLDIPLELKDIDLAGNGKLWIIAGSDPMAFNEPGKKPGVVIEEQKVSGITNQLKAPALGLALYALEIR